MDNLNSINNNSVPYYFKADIAKEGGQYVRLSNFFKARVGDNGKVLPFKWYDQGRVMNVHGYIPFIQGLIGKFSTDDNDEVIMAPDASYREWQGSTSNAHDGGFIDYILEDQMFPQEGIFKGHFGLKDGNGNVLTSVNIIFEVLGNDLRVGETAKYYIGELENLKNQYKIQGEQAVADFNAKIEAETENNRTAMNALSERIQVNSDRENNLTDRLINYQAQIDSQNIVTKPEYDTGIKTISDAINQRLSQMKTAPVGVASLSELQSKYPNGTDGVFLALDTKHIYIWLNGSWADGGVYQSATLDGDTQKAIGDTKSIVLKDNLIPNGSFSNGSVAPASGNAGTEQLTLFNFLNRTWLNVATTDTKAYQGVSWTFTNPILAAGISYPFHIEFDLVSQDISNLLLIIYGTDGKGARIGGDSGGVIVDTITTSSWQMKHESVDVDFPPSLENAATITIQLVQPDTKVINNLRVTGLLVYSIIPNNRRPVGQLADSSSLMNGLQGNIRKAISGTISVLKNFAGTNWWQLTGTNTDPYNGFEWIIDNPFKDLGQSVPMIISFDLLSADETSYYVNVLPLQANNQLVDGENGKNLDIINSQTWGLYHESVKTSLPFSYVKADKLKLQIVQADAKSISDLRLTNLKWSLLYKEQNNSEHAILKPDFIFGQPEQSWGNGNATLSTVEYLSKYWLQATTTDAQDNAGVSFKIKNSSSYYSSNIEISFDAISVEDTELQVDCVYFDKTGKLIGVQAFDEHLKLKANENIHYENISRLNATFKSADYFVFQIVQTSKKILTNLKLADVTISQKFRDITAGTKSNNLPIVSIIGDLSDMSKTNAKNITYEIQNDSSSITGYGTLKWQGDSSSTMPKKGYRLKTLKSDYDTKDPIQVIPSWGKHTKFNLKAYYTDGLMSRDPIAAKIGGAMSAERDGLPKDLLNEDNFGYIDGFPVVLYLNGSFQGVYSFNLPRPDFDYTQWAIMGGDYTAITQFNDTTGTQVKLDGTDFEMLNPEDKPTVEAKNAVTDLIKWVVNSTDEEFKADLSKHFDINSLKDYLILTNIVGGRDSYGKNQILMTWDGQVWYYQAYDLDCTYNANWAGGATFPSPKVGTELPFGGNHKLFARFSRLFKDQIAERYQEVRQWCTPEYVINLFKDRVDKIGQANFEKEWNKWNDPSKDTEDFKQLRSAVYDHFKAADAVWLKKE